MYNNNMINYMFYIIIACFTNIKNMHNVQYIIIIFYIISYIKLWLYIIRY